MEGYVRPMEAWPDGKRVGVLFNVAYEAWEPGVAPGVSPMGNPLPPGVVDTQAVDWGLYAQREGISRLERILGEAGVRATVFASGCLGELTPDTLIALAGEGHAICGHSYYQNRVPATLDPESEAADIRLCQEALEPLIGRPLEGWISPRATPSSSTSGLLAQAGFLWHGDTFDRDVAYVRRHPDGDLVHIPLTMELNDLPFFMKQGRPPEEMLTTFDRLLHFLLRQEDQPGQIDVTAHAHVFGRPLGASVYQELLQRAGAESEVWTGTRDELARHVRAVSGDAATPGRRA